MQKILIFHHHGGIGGAGLSLIHIVKSLLNDDREITIYCPDTPDDIAISLNQLNCKVIKVKNSPKIFPHYNGGLKNMLSVRTLKNLLDIVLDVPKINNIIREIKPDTIIVNSMTLFWIGGIAKQFSIKTICFHRETYIKGIMGFRTKVIKKGLSHWFDKVIFISKHDLQESKEIKAEKHVVYDRVDFTLFEDYSKEEAKLKLNLNKDTKYVLYLGGFSNLKGSHIIMESFKYLKDLNIKLLFVGGENKELSGWFEKLLNKFNITSKSKTLQIYKKYNLKESIVFFPKTTNPEIFYKAADISTFPSTKPHQARPIYESGITKIPVIITDFKETKEFAKDNYNAITFSMNNSKELAEKILLLLEDKNLKEIVVKNNYNMSKKNHDFLSLSKQLNEIL